MLTATQIAQIQTKGRDVMSLLRLMPGVRDEDDIEAMGESFGSQVPNVGGQRRQWNQVTVDGLNGNELSGTNRLGSATNLDAIAEVKVLLGGYASFNRYYFSQQDKIGVIVDERFNGGGSAADYIIDVLQRDFDGYFNNVAGDRYPFISRSPEWGKRKGGGGDRGAIQNSEFRILNSDEPAPVTTP